MPPSAITFDADVALRCGRRSARLATSTAAVAALLAAAPLVPGPALGQPQVLQVGPQRAIKTLGEAARAAGDGAWIEVDAGDYVGDVAVWKQDDLRVKAVGGHVRLLAQGRSAEGKGTWVVRGRNMRAEGFEFDGARTSERNGAGIRLESGSLTVANCRFLHNENGILTSNKADVELRVENSEFGFNGAGDGLSHHLYAGAIASLTVTGSYFHHANVGHLLKSRAAVNRIHYNRLGDEIGGRASYELNLPNGGVAYVVGNVIQQSPTTENPYLIAYGEEGYRWPRNALFLVNNTLVDKRSPAGTLLRVAPGKVEIKAVNNLLAGRSVLDTAAAGDIRANTLVLASEFVAAAADDYRLRRPAGLRGSVVDAGRDGDEGLMPTAEYHHPTAIRPLAGPVRLPGALQSTR